ncbi:MAG TPA: hypothetical protein VNA20_08900 [Frankiaceae bacterium]|nr:hypothetical protein [Frankiaceae bacterium]
MKIAAFWLCASLVATGCAERVTPVTAPLPAPKAGECLDRSMRLVRVAGAADSKPSLTGAWASVGWVYVGADRRALPGRRLGAHRPPSGDIEMEDRAAASLRAEIDAGGEVVAGVEGSRAWWVAALRPDGSVVFIGECAYAQVTRPLERYVAHRAGDAPAREVFLRIVAQPQGAEARAFAAFLDGGPGPSWHKLPPDRRAVGSGALPPAPPEVLAQLTEVLLRVDIPPAWRTMPGTLCPRISLGWGAECLSLGAGESVGVTAYLKPGEDLEVWLMEPGGDYRARIGVLGRVPARAAAPGDLVEVAGDPRITTFAQLRRVATATHDGLLVR